VTTAPDHDEMRIRAALRALTEPTPRSEPDTEPEPRWDWRRLRHWPHAGLTTAIVVAMAPLFGGQSLATGWGHALRACRHQASVGGAWTLAGITLLIAVTVARWRPRWYTRCAVIVGLFGTAYMASPYDIVTFVTGVTR
jgi:hypothetical protein